MPGGNLGAGDPWVAIIVGRGSTSQLHGAWLVNGYGILESTRTTVTNIETASYCSITINNSSISISNSHTANALFVYVLELTSYGFTYTIT